MIRGDADDLWDAVAEIVGVAARAAWRWAHLPPRPRSDWRAAAEGARLVPLGGVTWLDKGEEAGSPLRVRFEIWRVGDQERGTRIVMLPEDWVLAAGLVPESRETERAKERGAREIETGDDRFDDAFYVLGSEVPVRAVLDAATRGMLLRMAGLLTLEVSAHELRGSISHDGIFPHVVRLRNALPLLAEAARRLRRPDDPVARLAHNATADPEPGVRRENLLLLVRHLPDSATTREVVRAACDDPSASVRVRAAIARGEAGRETLLALARTEEEDLPAARAIAALGEGLPTEEVVALLNAALRARRTETAHECLLSLGRRADGAAVAAVAKVLAVDKGALAVSAAQALGASPQPEAEGPLVSALQRSAPELREAAAAALARVGSTAAVLPLMAVEAKDDHWPARRAARQAVAAIQSRVPRASAGQLSLATTDAGALSLAEDESGRLSLPDPRRP